MVIKKTNANTISTPVDDIKAALSTNHDYANTVVIKLVDWATRDTCMSICSVSFVKGNNTNVYRNAKVLSSNIDNLDITFSGENFVVSFGKNWSFVEIDIF